MSRYEKNLITTVDVIEERENNITFFEMKNDELRIRVTNHSYFNLSAGKEKIYDHYLKIDADQIAYVDGNCCTTGEFMNVKDTPFDFHDYHKIDRINNSASHTNLYGKFLR